MKHLCAIGVLLAGLVLAPAAEPTPLPYDYGAYELAPQFSEAPVPWNDGVLNYYLVQRVAAEKQRREMQVYYYRIGYTLAFPLGLGKRPTLEEFPAPMLRSKYPWLIWLSWNLEERWRLLHFAWRHLGDAEAGALLQKELAALATWDRFAEVDDNIGLLTGHFAGVLALALADESQWDKGALAQTRAAAQALVERDVWPWFEKKWPEKKLAPKDLLNIPAIALVRSAQLARVINSPRTPALEARSRQVLQAWCNFRTTPERHTEGTTYDGYLMDSVTEWVAGLPDREAVLKQCQAAFQTLAQHDIQLTLPGRLDLQAPLGDVEPEMTFWANVLVRLAAWYQLPDANWAMRRIPLARLRVPALVFAFEHAKALQPMTPPAAGPVEHPNALSLRAGWKASDPAVFIGLTRGGMGHLQADSGQVVLGWQGRFWITDPGYQQYRPGDERDFTLGIQAHNTPIIFGTNQTQRAGRLLQMKTNADGTQYAQLDLTPCYQGLPSGAALQREIWLKPDAQRLTVRDTFAGLPSDLAVTNCWQAGTHLAWSFKDGWARLSDGQRAVWIGVSPGKITSGELIRHPGTRGPLTLAHPGTLAEGPRTWTFVCDEKGGWNAPSAPGP